VRWSSERLARAPPVGDGARAAHAGPTEGPGQQDAIDLHRDGNGPAARPAANNASVDVVRQIADRIGVIDVAVLFAGAVQIADLCDGAYLTLSSDRAAEATKVLGVRATIPVHFEGWTHFTQGADQLRAAFAGNGIGDRLVLADPGATVEA